MNNVTVDAGFIIDLKLSRIVEIVAAMFYGHVSLATSRTETIDTRKSFSLLLDSLVWFYHFNIFCFVNPTLCRNCQFFRTISLSTFSDLTSSIIVHSRSCNVAISVSRKCQLLSNHF